MNMRSFKSWSIFILRLLIGVAFSWAGLIKFQDAQSFGDDIDGFQLLPDYMINFVAISLPLLEFIIGTMLIIGFQKRVAIFSAIALLLVYTLVLLQALVRGLPIDCGCFGPESSWFSTGWAVLWRDLILLCAATFIYVQTLTPRISRFLEES